VPACVLSVDAPRALFYVSTRIAALGAALPRSHVDRVERGGMDILGGLGSRGRSVIVVAAWSVLSALAPNVASAITRNVDNTVSCSDTAPCTSTPCCTIQFAIDVAVNNDVVEVAAGTYPENLTLGKNIFLRGAQAGNPACDRVDVETTVAPAAGVALTLTTGSSSATVDGFTFSGGTRGIATDAGPLNRLKILNNRIVGFSDSGAFFALGAPTLRFEQNEIDGSSATGTNGLFHLDGNNDYDGLAFRDTCVRNGVNTYGFFVDGDHNVGSNVDAGNPLIEDSRFENNLIGLSLGAQSGDQLSIARNSFTDNGLDGLQGGMQSSTIDTNAFVNNGRYGLLLTSFGNGDPAAGAQNNGIVNNCISRNGAAGIFYSDTQAAGTIATNVASDNNIYFNFAGAVYGGAETIDAENNWWGCPTGANTGACDTASANISTTPFLSTPSETTPCEPLVEPTPTPTETDGATPTPATTPTLTATADATPSVTATAASTATSTPSATLTPEATTTATTTPVATVTATPVATTTATTTPVATTTGTTTPIATLTATPVATATATTTPVATLTATPVATTTATTTPVPTLTTTAVPTVTATGTPLPTTTASVTATTQPTATPTAPITDPTPTTTPVPTDEPTATAATPGATFTATPTAPVPTPTLGDLNHFQCYETHRPPLRLDPLSLVDHFGASTARLLRGKRFCAPADKNDEDESAPLDADHLASYTIKQTTPRFTRIRDFVVTNQFGTTTLDLVRPEALLVPSAKSHVGPIGSYTPAIDHFKCYKARGRFRSDPLTIDDQFGSITAAIKRPVRYCAPVDKNGEGIIDAGTHLVCYQVRSAAGSPTGDELYSLNQFGPDEFKVFGARELCVPSTIQ
jgi:hypothetical protein